MPIQPDADSEWQQRLSELEQTNRALRLLSSINALLLRAGTEAELIAGGCRIAVEVSGYRMVWVGFAEDDAEKNVRPICCAGHVDGYLSAIHSSWAECSAEYDVTGAAIRSGQPVLINDIAAVPTTTCWRDEALQRGYRAVLALPLTIDGRVDGALTFFSERSNAFTPEERALLEEMAGNLSYGISALRAREQHRLAEEALVEREITYRELFEKASEAMLLHDISTTEIYDVNEAFTNLYGYTREEAVHLTIAQLTSDRITEMPETALHEVQAARRRGTHMFTWLARKKDGSDFWAEVTLKNAMIRGEERILAMVRDISERRRAEQALHFTQFAVDHMADAAYWMDRNARFIYVNQAACDALGYTKEELLSRSVMDIDPDYTMEDWQRDWPELQQIGVRIFEIRHKRKTGEIFPVEIHANYLLFEGKEYDCAFARDITERKQAEETITRERTFLATAIELMPFPILFFAPTGKVLHQNSASTAFLQETHDLSWKNIHLLDPQTHTAVPRHDWPIEQASQGKRVPSTEWIIALPGGREVPILLQAVPIIIDANFVAVAVALQDISTLKELDQAKNQFLMVLSHELKTPLTSIIGWAQMAQSAPDVAEEALGIILRNAREQQKLLERLLILSRLLTDKLVLRKTPTDLWQLAVKAASAFRQTSEERQLTLVLHPPAEELPVMGDSKLLQQAIYEVLENAMLNTAAGGRITLSGSRRQAWVLLEVRDNGVGIATEHLPILCKPFHQLQREERKGGSGIGLALACGIVERHGGQFRISSEGIGKGTQVTLELPRDDVSRR